jgi:CBS domain-containing protein
MPKLPPQTEWLRANTLDRMEIGVDRENAILRGYVVAQEGPFKSAGRGEFDVKALKSIVTLMNKNGTPGTKSRFAHPTLSGDGIGKFLGRAKNPKLDTVRVMRNGEKVLLHAVRADLHFDQTALEEPPGGGKPLGIYVMDLAESDPDAISSSVVVQADQEERLDAKGRPMLDAEGNPLPPLWRPKAIHASDVVDTGDAVDGILSAEGLSADGLPDHAVREACKLLSEAFPNADRETIKVRALAWVDRFLSWKFGDDPTSEQPAAPKLEIYRKRLELWK